MSGPLKKYRVKRNGFETVMKLSDDDAKRLGVAPDQAVDAASTIEPVRRLAADDVSSDFAADDAAAPHSDGDAGSGDGDDGSGEGGDAPSATPESEQPSGSNAASTTPTPKAAPKKRASSARKPRTSASKDGGAGGGDD